MTDLTTEEQNIQDEAKKALSVNVAAIANCIINKLRTTLEERTLLESAKEIARNFPKIDQTVSISVNQQGLSFNIEFNPDYWEIMEYYYEDGDRNTTIHYSYDASDFRYGSNDGNLYNWSINLNSMVDTYVNDVAFEDDIDRSIPQVRFSCIIE